MDQVEIQYFKHTEFRTCDGAQITKTERVSEPYLRVTFERNPPGVGRHVELVRWFRLLVISGVRVQFNRIKILFL